MIIKCNNCIHLLNDGIKKTCKKCKAKTVFGRIQEQFIEACPFYKQYKNEKFS